MLAVLAVLAVEFTTRRRYLPHWTEGSAFHPLGGPSGAIWRRPRIPSCPTTRQRHIPSGLGRPTVVAAPPPRLMPVTSSRTSPHPNNALPTGGILRKSAEQSQKSASRAIKRSVFSTLMRFFHPASGTQLGRTRTQLGQNSPHFGPEQWQNRQKTAELGCRAVELGSDGRPQHSKARTSGQISRPELDT